jgi:hypothetical protein
MGFDGSKRSATKSMKLQSGKEFDGRKCSAIKSMVVGK